MKIKLPTEQKFAGKVEVAVCALDERGIRFSAKSGLSTPHRQAIRLEETNVGEVYGVIIKALQDYCNAKGGE